MINNQNVPKLRFKEFSGEWEEKKLGDIATFYNSKRIPLTESDRKSGIYPYYGASGIIDYVEDYIFDGEYILLGEDGANIITRSTRLVFLATGKFWVNNHAHIFQAKESNTFLCEALERVNYVNYNTGTAQPKLNAEVVKKIKIRLPILPEQQKIASFLSAVDTKIDQLTRKKELLEQYKKGVTQKIFSQEIRFKADDGSEFPEWEEKKLGDIFERVTRKNRENNQNILTISAQQGLVNQEEYFSKSVSAKDVSNYYLLHRGDFAYNKSYSNGYPMGAIKRLNKYDKGVVSTLYICFQIKSNANANFYEQYFNGGFLNREIGKIAQEGARNHGLLNVSIGDFFENVYFFQPSSIDEQTKISDFLTAIDTKIYLATKQLDTTKQFKKTLLQQMFV